MSESNVTLEQTETPVEAPVEAKVSETPTEEAKPSFIDTFEYSFDKTKKKVTSEDELRELVELGEYYRSKAKDGDQFLKDYAKKNNMSKSELIEAMRSQEEANKIQYIAETEGVSEETAKKLYKADMLEEKFANEERTKTEQKKIDDQMTAL